VTAVLVAFAAELDATLALLGLRTVAELRDAGTDVLRLPADWGWRPAEAQD
jgi:isopentenyl diphosphate isomerase/L-lactate dehydrogenase-like FMN-dependent dehydrogenase